LVPRVNVLALAGATLAVVSMYLIWYHTSEVIRYMDLGMADPMICDWTLIDGYERMRSSFPLWLPFTLFIIGTIAAFITPLGGIVQLSGVVLFFYTLTNGGDLPAKIGPYVGLISGALALTSMVYPIGLGYRRKPINIVGRLLVFSPDERSPQPTREKRP
jgi:hypothetical protein